MEDPLLLDLYCCQGGAAAGYAAAGFSLLGGDLAPQPRYPYPFLLGNALLLLRQLIDDNLTIAVPGLGRRRVRAVHASPPCQRRTRAQKIRKREHPALIAPTRDLLIETGLPYVIENVPPDGPDDDPLKDPVELCGAMFGLHTYRHRHFETNFHVSVPDHPAHVARQVKMGRPVTDGEFYQAVGNFSNVDYARRDMSVPWMTRDGVRECIPPAYSWHVGYQLRELL